MKKYSLIDHTADIGIKLKAGTLKSLFVHAAEAMFDVIAERLKASKPCSKKEMKIDIKAADQKELFIRWLSELLSLADCEGVFFTDFKISQLSDTNLVGTVYGLPCKEFIGKREIKAATYHHLKLEKKDGGYYAEVIFDV